MSKIICPYCGKEAELVDSKIIYKKSYGWMYLCRCKPELVYVGCHKGTTKPLGRLADSELRQCKKQAHALFDPIWQRPSGGKSRRGAYNWLADKLGIPMPECHIGMFDVEMCRKVIAACREIE
jgi:hypothetical protein